MTFDLNYEDSGRREQSITEQLFDLQVENKRLLLEVANLKELVSRLCDNITKAKSGYKMEWKKDTKAYFNGEVLLLGSWKVGCAFFDIVCSKNNKMKYAATCVLPGIKDRLGNFKTINEAKTEVEVTVKLWLSRLSEVVDDATFAR
jgi:hypothetical protein